LKAKLNGSFIRVCNLKWVIACT